MKKGVHVSNKVLLFVVAGLDQRLTAVTPGLTTLGSFACRKPFRPVWPAVTSVMQATMTTGVLPEQHGIIANGFYAVNRPELHAHFDLSSFPEFRRQVSFWEQSNTLLQAPRVWKEGGKQLRTAMLFWQNSMRGAADVVITSGGVSVGEADFVKDLLAKLGEVVFWKIAMKPGRPLAYGRIGGAHFFGLPGNPVAAMLMVEEYVRPALRRLMGFTALHRPVMEAVLEDGWRGKGGDRRTTFLRVVARREGDQLLARLTGPQGSGILSSMLDANALAVIPAGTDRVEPGGAVTLHLTELAEDH
jgi:hypothetical protein